MSFKLASRALEFTSKELDYVIGKPSGKSFKKKSSRESSSKSKKPSKEKSSKAFKARNLYGRVFQGKVFKEGRALSQQLNSQYLFWLFQRFSKKFLLIVV